MPIYALFQGGGKFPSSSSDNPLGQTSTLLQTLQKFPIFTPPATPKNGTKQPQADSENRTANGAEVGECDGDGASEDDDIGSLSPDMSPQPSYVESPLLSLAAAATRSEG